MVMVETIGLSKSFGSIKAVDDLTFSVKKGEVLGFLGPNGAGKSTTMRILTAFIPPDSGTARVCGHDVVQNPLAVRQSLGYLPEAAPAYPEMTVSEFLEFVGKVRGYTGADLSRAVDGVMEKCRLGAVRNQTFDTLSKGFKRRTVLAQALIHDPPVLILDEPTDGLDPNQKHEVRRLILEMAAEKCIILSTHILEEVDAVCTRAVIIGQGRILSDSTPEELRRMSPSHGSVLLGIQGTNLESAVKELGTVRGVKEVKVENSEGGKLIRLRPAKGQSIVTEVSDFVRQKGWNVREMTVERGQLDEVFRSLTTGGGDR